MCVHVCEHMRASMCVCMVCLHSYLCVCIAYEAKGVGLSESGVIGS